MKMKVLSLMTLSALMVSLPSYAYIDLSPAEADTGFYAVGAQSDFNDIVGAYAMRANTDWFGWEIAVNSGYHNYDDVNSSWNFNLGSNVSKKVAKDLNLAFDFGLADTLIDTYGDGSENTLGGYLGLTARYKFGAVSAKYDTSLHAVVGGLAFAW